MPRAAGDHVVNWAGDKIVFVFGSVLSAFFGYGCFLEGDDVFIGLNDDERFCVTPELLYLGACGG